MHKIILLILCTMVCIKGIQAQEKLDVETILARADSVYAKFETARFIYQSKKPSEDASDILMTGKVYLAKSDESALGFNYHIENFKFPYTQIFDGKQKTTIYHHNKTYQILYPNTSGFIHSYNGPHMAFFKNGYLKGLATDAHVKSLELLADTIIQGILCFQVKLITDPNLEGYSDRHHHYYFQKENYFCKGYKVVNNDLGVPQWKEHIIVYAEVNKELDKGRFDYHKNIKPNYKRLKTPKPLKKIPLLDSGKKIPKFKGYTLDSKKVTRKALLGKITILDFWFIHCPPCVKAMPTLDSIALAYSDSGVQVIGMNPSDKKDEIKEFKNSKKSSLETLSIDYKTAKKFDVTTYPSLYIIDKNGRVAFSMKGYNEDLYSILSEQIDKLLQSE